MDFMGDREVCKVDRVTVERKRAGNRVTRKSRVYLRAYSQQGVT